MERNSLLNELYSAIREGRPDDLKKLISSSKLSKKELRDCFYGAVLYNKTDVATALLESGFDFIPRDKRCAQLYVAAVHSNLKIVELLLKKVDEIDKFLAPFLLELSVSEGSEKVVKLILNKGVSVHLKVKGYLTSIHIAVEKGHVRIIEYLLTVGADVNSKYDEQRQNCTLLCYAVGNGNEDVVQVLLKHGADKYVKSSDGTTAIYVAVKKDFVRIAKFLFQDGADVNFEVDSKVTTGEKCTLLHIASEKGYNEMVKLLLEHKADVSAVDSSGKTAFYIAAEKGHSEVVKMLLDYDSAGVTSKNEKGDTLLHSFSADGLLKSVETLLKCGIDVDCKNNNERTPLFLATKNSHEEIVHLLVKHGADINYKNDKGWAPLHFFSAGGFEKSVECLLKCGAEINAKDSKGKTSLYFAAQNGKAETVQLLLKHGAEIDSPATDGSTPLSVALSKNKTEVVKVLLKSGAGVESKAVQTILFDLVEKGREEVVKLLLKHGVKFSSDSRKLTDFLFYHAGRGNVEIVEALLKSGARVDATPHPEGKTPLFHAAEFSHEKVIKLLLDYGADVNSRELHGETPLLPAVFLQGSPGSSPILPAWRYGHRPEYYNSIKILLEYGARVDDSDYSANRNTALSFAAEKYWLPDVLKMLLEYASVDAAVVREKNMHFLFLTVNKYGPICHLVPENIPSHGISSAEILVKHTIKMKAAKLYVDADNFKATTYCNKTVIRNFQSKCEKEIATMKGTLVAGTNLSFYDVLVKHPYQIARFLKNETVIKTVKSGGFKKQFPIYANNIGYQFEKGQVRNRLLKEAVSISCCLFKHLADVPDKLMTKILDYLSNFDLRSLIRFRIQNK